MVLEDSSNNLSKMSGEEIVVTGMSGVFPNSDSVSEFMDNLYNKVDMVSDEPRWSTRGPEVPTHMGKVSQIEKFDANFFKVGYQQALVLDPISRKILEHAYGAIFDAGYTRESLKGKVIGVFIGSSFSEYCSLSIFDIKNTSDFIVAGTNKSMFANRISYWMDGKGPSYCVDLTCASSSAALELAYKSMRTGQCDAAVVGGANLCTHPMLSLNLRRYGLLTMDGKTKCFDKQGDGYVRSEAVSLIFLQKAKDAKRIYAEICHTKGTFKLSNDLKFFPLRKSEEIQEFINNVYSETDIDPKQIEYVEANGVAIPEADENEVDALAKIFAGEKAVAIGSVKSNMGHSEAASGLCGLTKLCLAYHKGELPANLHYTQPQDDSAIKNGTVQVLTENTKFKRGYTALNNFSYTGANFHVVLKGHYKEKNLEQYKTNIPYLVLASGRQDDCVKKIFDELKKKPIDAEEVALLHDVFGNDIVGHTGRGYTLLDTNGKKETVSVSEWIDYYPGLRRPLWLVYSGMGSQWPGMGADLMRIPTFAAAIRRCHKVLHPKGVDVIKVVSESDNKTFDNILHAFVGITAVQIGLTDLLKDMGIVPDYIIGHSLGELACAYHDNTLTTEEVMLATYSRGKAVLQSNLKPGLMAAVGIGYQELRTKCPPEIDIACHNSSQSSTISGPVEPMKKFIGELTQQGIFAREINSAGIAYHSRYVADAGPYLLKYLREIIKDPKPRSEKWICTSVPKENWNLETAKYSSAEYHTNNLLSSVYFEEMTRMIPNDAVVLEIAPHGLMQAIIKRSHPQCLHVPLTKRGVKEGMEFFLDAIGKLYIAGYNPKIKAIYPKIEYPVSTETPLLSHLVEWEHSEDWPLLKSDIQDKVTSCSRNLVFSVHDDDYSYIQDHVINEVTVLPEAALLLFVWETLAMYKGKAYQNMSVTFTEIHFHSEITIDSESPTRLSVMISKGNDTFEVSQEDKLIVSGIVNDGVEKFSHNVEDDNNDDNFGTEDIQLDIDDVYQIFYTRGYSYRSKLQTIQSANLDRNKALIKWSNEWVPFLDGLIQLNALARNFNGVSQPKFIRKIQIDVLEQQKHQDDNRRAQLFSFGVTRCAGVEIEDVTFTDKPRTEKPIDLMKARSFFSYNSMEKISVNNALEVNLQIIAECGKKNRINIINTGGPEIVELLNNVVSKIPNIDIDITHLEEMKSDFVNTVFKGHDNEKTNVIVHHNLLQDKKMIKVLQNLLSENTFLITLEDKIPQQNIKEHFSILTSMSDGNKILIMMKKVLKKAIEDVCYIPIAHDNTFGWVTKVLGEIKTAKRVVLVSERQPYCGLLGLVNKLKTKGYNNIGLIVIDDFHAPKFDPENNLFKEQIVKDLTINILKKGQWGGFYYTSCDKSTNERNIILKSLVPGDLDKLTWIENKKSFAGNNFVQVIFSGLSSRDGNKAIKPIEDNADFGMDFSGLDKNGDEIMGLVLSGSVASTVNVDDDLIWPVPDHWTLEDAATVPLPYVYAYYTLIIRGGLEKQKTVFINEASDALNQAVISICLDLNCSVFLSVKDEHSKKLLMKMFPDLNENHVGLANVDDMRLVFENHTLRNGCNVVINMATGYNRELAMKYVCPEGVFMDLSTHDMEENKHIGMSYVWSNRSYVAVDPTNIFRKENQNERKVLHSLLSEGIAAGTVKPLTRSVFGLTEVSKALRTITLNKSDARVLVRMRDPKINFQNLNIIPRIEYTPDDVLILVCNDEVVGIELADRLVKRGAKKLVIHLKAKNVSGYIHTKIVSWGIHGVSLKLSTENLQTEQGCGTLVKNSMKFGKVKGIFIVFEKTYKDVEEFVSKNDFINSFNEKCLAVMNLELASRNCMDLRQFVIIQPTPHSLSDEYALSLIDKVSETRNQMGLPTLVLRFQSLGESDGTKSKSDKTPPTSLSALFNSLEASLKLKQKNVFAFEMQEGGDEFCEKVAKVLGVADFNTLDGDTLINNLGLSVTVLKELRNVIYQKTQIDYPLANIMKMSIGSIKDLANKSKAKVVSTDNGIETFINEIDSEMDYIVTEMITEMPSLRTNCSFMDSNQSSEFITLIPGFEGRSSLLTLVAERLKIPAFCVQMGPDLKGDSVHDIAAIIKKEIQTKLTKTSKFYLLGYSFGVNICLELAKMFENDGFLGTIFCLDSSPDALRSQLDTYIGTTTQSELQNKVISHMYTIMSGKEDQSLEKTLENIESFEEKIEACINKMNGAVTYSKDYKRNVLELACKRMMLAKEYEPGFKLDSELVLMKGLESKELPSDYGLSKYTNKKVQVFQLSSNHTLAPYDCRVSNIVNKFLSPTILEEFEKDNQCNVYYVG